MIRKPVVTGGLMRCCLKTLDEYRGSEDEGTRIECSYCHDGMAVDGGKWKWSPNDPL